ncbi:MAG: 3'-5' exonuclease [Spirochaetia bacterium]
MNNEVSVAEVEFAAFDFETTGLHSATDRIVEFGAVRFCGSEITAEFGMLVNPGIPIGADAGAVSGITDADVMAAPSVDSVLPSFIEFLGDSVLIAHNAPFDLGFLRSAVQSAGLSEIRNEVIDTQLLAMKAFPKRQSYALQSLATELKLPRSRAHRAKDDAEMCMKLFLASVEALSFMGDLQLAEVLTGAKKR